MNTSLNNAPRIIFGNDARVQDFTLILSSKSLKHLGQITNIPSDSITYSANFNSADELSFTVYKEMNSQKESLWDDIKQFSVVWVKELNQYFEITFSKTQKNDVSKEVVCTSLCEAELSQINLYDLEINTQDFWDDYAEIHKGEDYELPVYIFYNDGTFGEDKLSLLDAIIEKAPHYSIGYVDDSLKKLQRTFSIDGTSIYDFMIGDLAKEFNCVFQFDTTTRTINVYDLYSVCENTNCSYYIDNDEFYREEGITECPYCGNKHLYYFGNDTTIFVEQNALTDEINFSTDTDAIKNCFKLEAGDEYMTDTVKNINYGSDYIMHFSDEMKSMMSDELVNAIESYEQEVGTYQEQYVEINEHIYELEDDLVYYESSMMPTVETDDTDAETEAAKLTSSALSPISLQSITVNTSKTSADNAVKNYALVYVTPGRFKVEVENSNWVPGNNTGTWTGTLKVTNYSDGDDVAITNSITITFNTNYQNFLEQKIAKQIYNNASKSDSSSIWGVLYTYNANTGKYIPVTKADFTVACTKYSLNRLESFYNSIETGLEVLKETGQGDPTSEAYNTIYTPLKEKLKICQSEINIRDSKIEDINSELGYYLTDADGEETEQWNKWTKTTDGNTKPYKQRRQEIQEHLSFDNWLKTRNLYDEFCSFRREDTYSNSNFISDLYYENDDNSGLMERAQEFLKQANTELIKSSTAQHSISTNLYNLLIMKDFQPLIKNFQLGNFIRVKCENDIYRMRLLHYEIDFGNINNLSTQFSDMTYVGSVVSDLQSVINSSKQMATSYSSVSKQSESGQEANNTFEDMRKQGLNAVLYNIKSNDTQNITIDEHGILGRAYDDITDSYDDKQIRINSNVIAFTEDNWESVSTALGYQNYYNALDNEWHSDYGLNANFVLAGYIQGSDIVGTRFWGVDSNNQKNGFKIDEAGNIYNGANSQNYLKADGTLSLGDGKITYNGTTLNVSGNITANTLTATSSGTIGPWTITSSALYRTNATFGASNGIYIGTNGISLSDKFKVTNTGALTATSGTVGGFTITANKIYGGDSSTGVVALQKPTETNTYVFAAGGTSHDSYADCPFRVTKAGKLYATGAELSSANVTGSITASSIYITDSKISFKNFYDGTKHTFISWASSIAESQDIEFNNLVGTTYMTFLYNSEAPDSNGVKFSKFVNCPRLITDYIVLNGTTISFIQSSDTKFGHLSATGDIFYFGTNTDNDVVFRPNTTGTTELGTGTYYWEAVHATTGGFKEHSDRKEKDVIESLVDDSELENFIMGLNPVMYTRKASETKRHHMGFIAQDVADISNETLGDLSLFSASVINKNGVEDEIYESYYDENVEDKDLLWELSYMEFIAPLVAMVQKQQKKIEEQQNKIDSLEDRILQLENLINKL